MKVLGGARREAEATAGEQRRSGPAAAQLGWVEEGSCARWPEVSGASAAAVSGALAQCGRLWQRGTAGGARSAWARAWRWARSGYSGLAEAFSTLALGRVPKGAMFATTPCLSIPASAKDGLGGASCGSILGKVSFDSARASSDEHAGASPLIREGPGPLCGLGHGLCSIGSSILRGGGKRTRISGSRGSLSGFAHRVAKPGSDLLFFSVSHVSERDRAMLATG
jgi:hypothetical protein